MAEYCLSTRHFCFHPKNSNWLSDFLLTNSVVNSQRNRVTVQVSGVTMGLKLTDVALPPTDRAALDAVATAPRPAQKNGGKKASISKAAEKALAAEKNGPSGEASPKSRSSANGSSKVTIRTDSNTVDVRGCNLEEAKSKAKDKFSRQLMMGRTVVYILHGHGTGGVLKTKIRQWLKNERQLVKNFKPADSTDGGDALTRVELQ